MKFLDLAIAVFAPLLVLLVAMRHGYLLRVLDEERLEASRARERRYAEMNEESRRREEFARESRAALEAAKQRERELADKVDVLEERERERMYSPSGVRYVPREALGNRYGGEVCAGCAGTSMRLRQRAPGSSEWLCEECVADEEAADKSVDGGKIT